MAAPMEGPCFVYGEPETNHLKSVCPKMAAAIEEIGPISRPVIPDLYTALVNSIVGQQISSKALATVWGRFEEKYAPMTPKSIMATPAEELQALGISMRKTMYIQEMTAHVLNGTLDLDALHTLSDQEVCAKLCEIKGVGVWTAEMLLIFSMQRPDVMSYGDLAILRGLRMLHRHRAITPKLFAKYKRLYSPHGTVASLYLWAIAAGACHGLTDPAAKNTK